MVERSLHQTEAAQRDLNVFQTLSKNAGAGTLSVPHLLDYVDTRSNLSERERAQLDLTQLNEEIGKHPDQPQNLYLLAEAYLKLGKVSEARQAVAQLDQFASADFRTQTGVGVLLARYRLYDDAIGHFRSALAANPDSDDINSTLPTLTFANGSTTRRWRSRAKFRNAGGRTTPSCRCSETFTPIWVMRPWLPGFPRRDSPQS